MPYVDYDPNLMRRLNQYFIYLEALPKDKATVDPHEIADALVLDPKIVRQDLKTLFEKDRVGEENREELLALIKNCAEVRQVQRAVLVGAGKLGSALMCYSGFSVHGVDIIAGFDIDAKKIKKGVYGKPVFHVNRIKEICQRLKIKIGIIASPGTCAQEICEKLVNAGIVAIWNFTAIKLKAPAGVMVYNEDMSPSLRRLADYAQTHK